MVDESKKYKLDKTVFRAMNVEEAGAHFAHWKKKTLKERMDAACYLINSFYNTTPQTPVDKTIFTKRKHQHG